jgi:2,3-dihydroxybenzoate-AMP ligase
VNFTYLAFHAVERPQDLVFVDREREISYAEMLRDLKKFIQAADRLGLVRGNSVAIGCDDFYTHWLLALAFEYLGIASTSFHVQDGAGYLHALLGAVDLALAEPHYPPGGWKTVPITPEWLQAVHERPVEAVPPPARWEPAATLRIMRTSGTTGEAKRIQLSYATAEARMQQLLWLYRERPEGTGFLMMLNFAVGGAFEGASLALRGGRTLIALAGVAMRDLPMRIRRHRLSNLALLPVQIKELLERLPADWVKPEQLDITAFGAPVPDELRSLALERLADRIVELYGSNEVGTVSVILRPGTGGFGTLLPAVEAQVVDEQERPLPDGELGQIRVRGAGSFDGYVGDPTLTRRMLREGWFYPGDLGILEGRQLQVVGRVGDQVNLGGVKFSLTKIEGTAQRSGGAGLKDVGAMTIPNAAGLDEIHIALVTDGTDDRGLIARIGRVLGPMLTGDLNLIRLPQIPRNDMGKIDRAKLKETILAAYAVAKAK